LNSLAIEVKLDHTYTYQDLEKVDKNITYLLNKIRKKIEGPSRRIPYSQEKVKRNAIIQYWRVRIREVQGKIIDKRIMLNREQYIETEIAVSE